MPKLSNKSLKKMFECEHCGQYFRTRQGLSGHIQWKHKKGKTVSITDWLEPIHKAKHFETVAKASGLAESRIKAEATIIASWSQVAAACDYLNINLNDQDYKNYIITSFARMHENERLKIEINNDIRNLLEEHTL